MSISDDSTKETASAAVKKLYKVIQHRTGAVGGYGHHGALYGEITMGSFQKIVNFLKENNRFDRNSLFIDIGAGLGKPNFHVLLDPGVKQSFGVELEELRWKLSLHNLTHVLAEVEELKPLAEKPNIFFARDDITNAETFEPFTHLYTFDVGFPPNVFRSMAQAFNASSTALVFVSFHKPKEIIRDYGFKADLCGSVQTRMHGSNEGHKCYIYRHLINYRRMHPEDLVLRPAVPVDLALPKIQTRLIDYMTQQKKPEHFEAPEKKPLAEKKKSISALEEVVLVAVKNGKNGKTQVEDESKKIIMIAPSTPKKRRSQALASTRSASKRKRDVEIDLTEPKNLFTVPAASEPKYASMFSAGFDTLLAHQDGSFRDWISDQLDAQLFTTSRPSRRQRV